jgi:hypothetical protein
VRLPELVDRVFDTSITGAYLGVTYTVIENPLGWVICPTVKSLRDVKNTVYVVSFNPVIYETVGSYVVFVADKLPRDIVYELGLFTKNGPTPEYTYAKYETLLR